MTWLIFLPRYKARRIYMRFTGAPFSLTRAIGLNLILTTKQEHPLQCGAGPILTFPQSVPAEFHFVSDMGQ